MEIRYKNKKVQEVCENNKLAIKKFNKLVAEKLLFSIKFLENAESLKDVADYSNFKFHELKDDRKGQYAIDLGRRLGYRIIIEPITEQTDKTNIVIYYTNITIIEIMEVSNHYE